MTISIRTTDAHCPAVTGGVQVRVARAMETGTGASLRFSLPHPRTPWLPARRPLPTGLAVLPSPDLLRDPRPAGMAKPKARSPQSLRYPASAVAQGRPEAERPIRTGPEVVRVGHAPTRGNPANADGCPGFPATPRSPMTVGS